MTAEVITIIGQLNIRDGSWRSDAPSQVAVREPKAEDAPGAGKGDLFVLTEVLGDVSNRESLEQQLAEAVRDAYYLARGSVTASLRRALQTVGEQLYERNYRVSAEKRIVVGVVVLVMCQDDAFVAQIGSTAFFTMLGNHVRRYPINSVWLDEALPVSPLLDELESEHEDPGLGLSAIVEPNLHHFRVEPGDMLILADSGLAGQLPLSEVSKAVQAQNIKVVVKNLGKVAGAKDCSALVIAVEEKPQSSLNPLKVAEAAKLGGFLSRQPNTYKHAESGGEKEIPEGEAILEPALVPAGAGAEAVAAAGRHRSGQASSTGPQVESNDTPAQEEIDYSSRSKPSPHGRNDHDHAPSKRQVTTSTSHEPSFKSQVHWRETSARQEPRGGFLYWLSAGPLLLVALLAGGLKTVFRLVLPGQDEESRPQAGAQAYRPQSSPVSWALLRNIAIAIPILIGIVVVVSYLQKGRLREAEYTQLVQNAQSKFQQSQAVDPPTGRALMAEAEALLVQAEEIKVNQPEIAELRTQMAEVSDTIGKVQRLYYLPQLRQYTDEGTHLKSIVVQGVEIYVLDTGTDRVYHHRLEDTGETLLPDDESVLLVSRGQAVDNIAVEELLDMVWMPVGGNRQTSDLLVVNSTGLLEYNPNWGLTTAAIAGRESLVLPVAASSFFGNLYILDAQGNHLWRYLPTADGYNSAPESYFPPEQLVDLTNAVDMAIDGSIYILFKDGRISKFTSGQPVEFSLSGLDAPFNNPVAIFTAPDEEVQHVYVADAGNQRIVQLNKDGSFVRQFKPRPAEAVTFANLQDIFIDEISGRLYVLDSNNLYVGNTPSE